MNNFNISYKLFDKATGMPKLYCLDMFISFVLSNRILVD